MADMHTTDPAKFEELNTAIPPIQLGDEEEVVREKLFYQGAALQAIQSSNVKIINEVRATQTAADGQYQENLQSIQTLSLEISAADADIAQLQQTISDINLTIDEATGDIVANNSQIQTLITDLNTAEADILANSSEIISIQATVNTLDDTVTANANSISQLSLDIATTNTAVSSNATNISSLSTDIDNANSAISANASNISQLTLDIQTANTNISANISNINSINANVSGLDTQVQAINSVTLDVNGFVTGYRQENDGSTGNFAIISDKFQLIKPTTNAIMLEYNAVAESLDVVGTMRLLSDVIGYANFNDKPTNLAGINSTEGSKLAGIEEGAQANYDMWSTFKNILRPSEFWKLGEGSITADVNWEANGSSAENKREYGIGPLGTEEILWNCYPDSASGGDGGWGTSSFSLDPDKDYVFGIYIKRTDTTGTSYFGITGGTVKTLGGSNNSNPYFCSGNLPETNKWYLLVGVLHHQGFSGTSADITGIYDCETGEKVSTAPKDFVFGTDVTLGHRAYHYYNSTGDLATLKQSFARPFIFKAEDMPAISSLVKTDKTPTLTVLTEKQIQDGATMGALPAEKRQLVIDSWSSSLETFDFIEAGDAIGWTLNNTLNGELESAAWTEGEVVDGEVGGKSLKITGTVWLYAQKAIPVDTSKTYRMRFKVRLTKSHSGSDRFYAGVATYDKDKVLQESSPGTHRYCVIAGRTLTVAEGWQIFEGLITGEGNSTHNQFRPDTAYVRPMFIANYKGGVGEAEVDFCSFGLDEITHRNIEDGSQVNADYHKTIGIKLNYASWTSANSGEAYIHGYDSKGVATNTDGYVWYKGVKYTVPRTGGVYSADCSVHTNVTGSGFIVFNTAGAGAFTGAGTGHTGGSIVFAKYENGQWYYDNNGAWIAFTPTSAMCIIGHMTCPSPDNIGAAEVYSNAMSLDLVAEAGANKTDLGSVVGDGNNLILNGNGYAKAYDGRPAGCKATYGSNAKSNISYLDESKGQIKLYSSTDADIGIGWPAFRLEANTKYKVRAKVKASAAKGNGFYLWIYELDSNLPEGITHISNNATSSEAGVVEDTRIRSYVSDVAIASTWQDVEFTYTPTSTAKYASAGMLNWTGMGTAELHIDFISITPIIDSSADNTQAKLNTTMDVSGTIRGINIEANSFKTILPAEAFNETTMDTVIELTEYLNVHPLSVSPQDVYEYGAGLSATTSFAKTWQSSAGEYTGELSGSFIFQARVVDNSLSSNPYGAVEEYGWMSDAPIQIRPNFKALPSIPGSGKLPSVILDVSLQSVDLTGIADPPVVYGLKCKLPNMGVPTSYAGHFINSNPGLTTYGIYAAATGGSTNWSGYFSGDAKVTGKLDTKYHFSASRTTIGTWTISGLISGKPLFLGVKGTADNEAEVALRVSSGAEIGYCTLNKYYSLTRSNATGVRTSPSFVTIPTSSTVSIKIGKLDSSTTLYAYQ